MTKIAGRSAPLRAGTAFIDVTPPIGVHMQGYGTRRAEGIADPLLATALALGRDGVDWLLLSIDCIGLDRHFALRIRERLARTLSMPASAITLACSHTHSGPATLPALGPVTADVSYLAVLEDRLAAAAETAAQRREEVRLRFGTTELHENVNRREWKAGRIELGVEPTGPVDCRLRVVRVDGIHDSSPIALIVHYACHPTSSAGVARISADWPGAMRAALQAIYNDGKPPVVCFLQGCAGDLTHRIGRERDSWPQHFGQHTSVQAQILGRLSAGAALTASERSIGIDAETVGSIVQPLNLRYHRHAAGEETEAQVIRIGSGSTRANGVDESVWIVALPGEPFTTYGTGLGDRLRREIGANPDHVLVCGYTNDCVGYLCSPRALWEGGYESARAHEIYHRPAAFSASTQALVFDRVSQAATRLTDKGSRPTFGAGFKSQFARLWSVRS